jgi:hypothetical protein
VHLHICTHAQVDALDELIQLSEKADLTETEEFMRERWASALPPPFKDENVNLGNIV